MVRLSWNDVGDRSYEHGVDRAVVYPELGTPSPWNGVVSISSSDDAEISSYYLDGIKYAQVPSFGEYSASIESYTTPNALLECMGLASLSPGLFAANQRRKSFGLCYRTLIGNDVDGSTSGYKLHLVYGALAKVNLGAASTDAEVAEAVRNTWDISTVPPEDNIAFGRPTAHLIIDSRTTPPEVLEDLEEFLYGSSYVDPQLPSPNEVQFIFNSPTWIVRWLGTPSDSPSELTRARMNRVVARNLATNPSFEKPITTPFEVRRNLCTNPSFEVDLNGWSGGSTATRIRFGTSSPFVGSYVMRVTRNSATPGNCFAGYNATLPVGTYTWSFYTRIIAGAPTYQTFISASGGAVVTGGGAQTVAFTGAAWVRVTRTFTVTTAGTVSLIFRDDGSPLVEVGQVVDLDAVLIEQTASLGAYFDGATSPDSTMIPAWLGTANASASVLRSTRIEVRRNLASDPCATTNGTVAGQARWSHRWFGSVGTGSTVAVSGATDGPEVAPDVRLPAYLRKTWTATGTVGDTGFDHTVPSYSTGTVATTGLPVTPGMTYTFSSYMRASTVPTGLKFSIQATFRDATGARITPYPTVTFVNPVAGQWVRVSLTATAPAGATTVSVGSDVGGTGTWPVGATLDGTGLLVEQAPVLGVYFDGTTSPDSDLTPAWTGTVNSSPSVLTGQRIMTGLYGAVGYQSSQWASSGTHSAKVQSTRTSVGEAIAFIFGTWGQLAGLSAGKTYTIMAKVRMTGPVTNSGASRRISLRGAGTTTQSSDQWPNEAGVHDVRFTATLGTSATEAILQLQHQGVASDPPIWVDDLAIVEGEYTGPWFDGSRVPDTN